MVQNWDECAAQWDSDPLTAQFADNAFAELDALNKLSGAKVIDFGCGTGLLSQRMSPFARNIVALDASEAMIEELDKKLLANVEPVVDELTRGLVAQHPAFRGQFDLVVASSVCGFLNNLKDTATIIHSLLDDNGLFVHWDWLNEGEGAGLTQKQAQDALHSAGFRHVVFSTPFTIATPEGELPVLMGVARK